MPAKELRLYLGLSRGRDPLNRIIRATLNSWNGILAAARSEAALRQELVVLAFAVPLAFVVGQGAWQRLLLVGVVLLLIVVELINTAIEKLADQVTAMHHPVIGAIKDMGSAAVGVAIAIAGITWLVALGERAGFW